MKASKVLIWVGIAAFVAVLGYALARPAGAVQKNIGNEELVGLVDGGARLVDVRSPGEYQMGHIRGAENVPDYEIAQAAQGWDRDQAIVLYCASGERSSVAMSTLASMGFTKVYNHAQGVAAWDGELTTETSSAAGAITTDGTPVLVEFTSDG